MGIVIGILWFLLCVVMLFLMLIILVQEGKGGGLGEAFGGAGAETFGVKATGVNRLTAVLGGAFLALAILINVVQQMRQGEVIDGSQDVLEQQSPAAPDSSGS